MAITRLLNVFTAAPYESMTFPGFRRRLREATANGPVIAVGASSEGRPVGLGLAELSPDRHRANVLSIAVDADHRRRGIGTVLLMELESALRANGCAKVELSYVSDAASTPSIEAILKKRHWSAPEPRMLLCRGDRRILEVPWIKPCRLPPGFTIFPWRELAAGERAAMQRQQELQPWYPEMLSPFRDEETQEAGNSLGLRHEGEIVGWLITHCLSPTLIRYSALFIRDDVRARGCVLPLFLEAFHRQAECRGWDSLGSWTVSLDNAPMVRFSRRLAPYLLSVRESRTSGKTLLTPSDALRAAQTDHPAESTR